MLKIKNNVDLKELEKFGFTKKIKYYDNGCISIDIKSKYIYVNNIAYSAYGDFIKTRNMKNSQRFYIDNILYDLIKADLVEKVEE